jgi:hypothetical protein
MASLGDINNQNIINNFIGKKRLGEITSPESSYNEVLALSKEMGQ